MPLQAPNIVQAVYGRNTGPIAQKTLTFPNPVTPGNTMLVMYIGSNNGIQFDFVPGGWNYLSSSGGSNGFYADGGYRVVQAGDGQSYTVYLGGWSSGWTCVWDMAMFELQGQPTLTPHYGQANGSTGITGLMSASATALTNTLALCFFCWDQQNTISSIVSGYTDLNDFGDSTHTGSPSNYAYGSILKSTGNPPAMPVTAITTWNTQPNYMLVIAGPVSLVEVQVATNPNAGIVGQPVAITVTLVSGGTTPTGTVTVTDSINGTLATSAPLVNGRVSFTTSALSAGTHTITASYSGDGTFAPNTGTNTQVMYSSLSFPTTTTLNSSENPSFSGNNVTFDVTVAPIPTGVIQSAHAAGSVTAVVTLGSPPTVGNTLLAFGGINLGGTPVGLPAGFNYLASYGDANVTAAVGRRTVQSGDGTTWTFTCANNTNGSSTNFYVVEVPGIPVIWAVVSNYTSVTSGGGSTVSTLPLPGGPGIGIGFFNRDGGWGTLSSWGPAGYAPPAWLNADAAAYTGIVPNAPVTAFLSYASTEVFAMAIEIFYGEGNPTGSVVLSDSLGGFSPQTLSLSGGTASYGPISTLSINTHDITAAYGGS